MIFSNTTLCTIKFISLFFLSYFSCINSILPFTSILKLFDRDPYSCSKCKYKFESPIEAVLEFEEEDKWNGLPTSTPPYIICAKCNNDKCVPIDYKSMRGFHHIYKEN